MPTKPFDADVLRMRPGSSRISTRFFVALFVLFASLVAVIVLGLVGLRDVQHANDQVFADNLVTAEATSQLALDLGNAERIGLELTASNSVSEIDALRAELDLIAIRQVDRDVVRFLRLHASDPRSERAELQRIPAEWDAAVRTERHALRSVGSSLGATRRAQAADAIADVMDPLIVYVSGREPIERDAAADAREAAQATYRHDRTWLIVVAVVAALAAAVMLLVGLALKRMVDQRARDKLYDERESEYIETLQVTENEEEAQELLRRQLERSLPDARAVVLVRNDAMECLEAKTPLADDDPLRERLLGATPRSCLAVRHGRGHVEAANDRALLHCRICGGLPGASTCEPLLAGSDVVGVVQIRHAGKLGDGPRQRVREAVAQAAPVLANLRNLAIAQRQAATDGLTGLPNRRSVEEAIKRMVAQSRRTITPMSALLVDIDHFKNVNDVYGHGLGDQVLAATGTALLDALRESDFVGRYGGEEFVLLLPATDRQSALQVAEKVRGAVGAIQVANVEQVTASIGVAVLPDDAGDALGLLRSADRALYRAKDNGRNRVESATSADRDAAVSATVLADVEDRLWTVHSSSVSQSPH
jgi:diguanylate cyclase (GGDEF)-like protein